MRKPHPVWAVRNVSAFTVLILCACFDALGPSTHQRESSAKRMTLTPPAAQLQSSTKKIPDQYIVVFDESVRDVRGRAAALAAASGGDVRFVFSSAIRGYSTHMSAQAAAAIAQHPGVEYVEQDGEVVADDTQSAASWGLDRIDQSSLPLNGSYSFAAAGSGVSVYIVDTGIRPTHSEFGGRASAGFSAISDGYGATGCNYHGTHVAGTVGGATVGVAKAAKLVSVRVLDCEGSGTISQVIAGLDWIIANRTLPAVANMSLTGTVSLSLNDAVQRLINSGVTVTVAAGNSGVDACSYSPASVAAALTVAATMNTDERAFYSNYGTCVDLFAPGNAIYSAMDQSDYAYGNANGTSMAAPHVAGAAALYLENHPNALPAEVGSAITGNATIGAVISAGNGSPNRLLRVNGTGETVSPTVPTNPTPTNIAPTAAFTVKCQKSTCTFDGSASTDDGRISSYEWNFGDGSTGQSAASAVTTHTYTQKGNYTVTAALTVRDENGLTSTARRSVQIKSGNAR